MVDGKNILDALVGAVASKNTTSGDESIADILGAALGNTQNQGQKQNLNQSSGGLGDLLNSALGGASGSSSGGGLGSLLGSVLSGGTSSAQSGGGLGSILSSVLGGTSSKQAASSGGLMDLVKDAMISNPALAKTVAAGAAGLLLGTKSGRSLTGNAAKLGGLALIGSLAYKSLKAYQGTASGQKDNITLEQPDKYVPASAQSNEGPLRLARTMIAAAMADGHLDADEKAKIAGGLSKAGGADASEWLKQELAHPATPEELAIGVNSIPEAAEIYIAARVTIEPDEDAEIDFLNRLGDALNLSGDLVAELDKSVSTVKEPIA